MSRNKNSYRNYQESKRKFKTEQVALPIAMLIIIAILSNYWKLIPALLIGVGVYLTYSAQSKANKQKSEEESTMETRKIEASEIEVKREEVKMAEAKTGKSVDKSTDVGYINKNNQMNTGKTSESGTDNMQWFYNMRCLDCGFTYKANGTDIWQRKCPNCQGGKK